MMKKKYNQKPDCSQISR